MPEADGTLVRTDCRHYRVTQPCRPHKIAGVRCGHCSECDPIDERILIVKLDAMGDVLRATSCLAPLKARYPRSHVTWVTRPNAVPLLAHNPMIDRILSIDRNYLELLSVERFDLAIGPDADLLSASIMALTTSESKCGYVADGRGSVTPLNDAAVAWWRMGLDDTLKRSNRRTYGEWLYAICDLPTPVARPCFSVPQSAADDAMARLRAQAPKVNRWACFNTGGSARWEEKRWKPPYYQQLARTVAEEMPGLGVVLIGGPEEEALNRELLRSHPGLIDGGTCNSIEQFAAVLAVSQWVLTADSLAYHLASAIGTPAFCLVGPTSPWELDTYGQNAVVHAPLDCIACYRARCPLATTCMDLLTPAVVWQALAQWSTQLPRSRGAEAEGRC